MLRSESTQTGEVDLDILQSNAKTTVPRRACYCEKSAGEKASEIYSNEKGRQDKRLLREKGHGELLEWLQHKSAHYGMPEAYATLLFGKLSEKYGSVEELMCVHMPGFSNECQHSDYTLSSWSHGYSKGESRQETELVAILGCACKAMVPLKWVSAEIAERRAVRSQADLDMVVARRGDCNDCREIFAAGDILAKDKQPWWETSK